MKIAYNTMRFGKKNRMITVLHLRKPIAKGLAGIISSKLFPQQIALVADPRPVNDMDYSFICLSRNINSDSVSVWMEPEVFYGIKRGVALARTSLFHELGHYYHGHQKINHEDMDVYDEARTEAVESGQVIQQELDADQFAVEYLGKDFVIRGLRELAANTEERIKDGFYDEETGTAAVKELELRISAISG